MSKRPTRDDVARAAGLSTASVSYVINNGPRHVSDQTRAKVLAAIKSTGYRPNGIAQSLAHGNTNTFALLVTDMTNPFLSQIAQALERSLFAKGKTLLIGDCGDDASRQIELLEAFQRQQVAGLVWYGVDQPLPLDAIADFPGTAVLLNQPKGYVSGNQSGRRIRVAVSEFDEARIATSHLLSHGYKHPCMVCGPKERLNSRERIRGWREAVKEASLEEGDIITEPYTRRGGYDAAAQVSANMDAIFVSNELQAIGMLAGLHDAGRDVPRDIALVSMNGTLGSKYLIPALTTVTLPHESLAMNIAEILTQGTQDDSGDVIAVEPQLVIGRSCGCHESTTRSSKTLSKKELHANQYSIDH